MKAARAAAIAGAAGTSNVAAAKRYGLAPVGTMAHSYVMSFATERDAFRAFMRDTPENAVMLVDTYDTVEGVRHAIAASRETGVPLKGVRLDSGDRLALSRAARELLDRAGMPDAAVVASGDLDERQIADLVAAGAPVDVWGVGTDLGTSRDSPAVGGVYKLVADRRDGAWRPVAKRSPDKATLPGAKQVFRHVTGGVMREDVLAVADERLLGRPLLEPVMRDGRSELRDPLRVLRARAAMLARSPAARSPVGPACALTADVQGSSGGPAPAARAAAAPRASVVTDDGRSVRRRARAASTPGALRGMTCPPVAGSRWARCCCSRRAGRITLGQATGPRAEVAHGGARSVSSGCDATAALRDASSRDARGLPPRRSCQPLGSSRACGTITTGHGA